MEGPIGAEGQVKGEKKEKKSEKNFFSPRNPMPVRHSPKCWHCPIFFSTFSFTNPSKP